MADHTFWDDVVEAFWDVGKVHHGDLGKGIGVDGMARDVLAGAPERFVLVGFSMGGYVAREVSRMAPDRVRALVLVATSARGDTPAEGNNILDSVDRPA